MLKKLVCIESDFEDFITVNIMEQKRAGACRIRASHNKVEEETYLLW